jgi:hypothetical protein
VSNLFAFPAHRCRPSPRQLKEEYADSVLREIAPLLLDDVRDRVKGMKRARRNLATAWRRYERERTKLAVRKRVRRSPDGTDIAAANLSWERYELVKAYRHEQAERESLGKVFAIYLTNFGEYAANNCDVGRGPAPRGGA